MATTFRFCFVCDFAYDFCFVLVFSLSSVLIPTGIGIEYQVCLVLYWWVAGLILVVLSVFVCFSFLFCLSSVASSPGGHDSDTTTAVNEVWYESRGWRKQQGDGRQGSKGTPGQLRVVGRTCLMLLIDVYTANFCACFEGDSVDYFCFTYILSTCFLFFFLSFVFLGRQLSFQKTKLIFQHFGRLFLAGTLKNVLCCLNELLVNFRKEPRGIGRFCRLESSNGWPTRPVSIFWSKQGELHETGRLFRIILPVSIFWSKLGQLAIRWSSSLQNRPIPLLIDSSRKLTSGSLREQGTFSNVPGRKSLPKCWKTLICFLERYLSALWKTSCWYHG